ncbi:hypothetical protein TNCT_716141, partial [Trichonephila clavata]
SRLTEYESNYLVAGCVSRKDIGITGDYSDEGSQDLKGRDDQAHCFCIGHAAFRCVSPPVEQPADKIPTPPAKSTSPPAKRLVEPERPVTPLERVDPSVLMTGAHVEVTSRLPTPPLMTRCNKSTQAYSSHLELGKRLLEQPPFLPNKKLAIQPKPLLNQPIPLFCLCPNIILC